MNMQAAIPLRWHRWNCSSNNHQWQYSWCIRRYPSFRCCSTFTLYRNSRLNNCSLIIRSTTIPEKKLLVLVTFTYDKNSSYSRCIRMWENLEHEITTFMLHSISQILHQHHVVFQKSKVAFDIRYSARLSGVENILLFCEDWKKEEGKNVFIWLLLFIIFCLFTIIDLRCSIHYYVSCVDKILCLSWFVRVCWYFFLCFSFFFFFLLLVARFDTTSFSWLSISFFSFLFKWIEFIFGMITLVLLCFAWVFWLMFPDS